jgi:hypothetical protein
MTEPEGQTARDAEMELQDEGIPDLEDGSPEAAWAEDPEFMPVPRDDPGASVDFGTTAFEQSQGESLTGRLARELPDDGVDVRRAADANQAGMQLEQDTSTSYDSDSGTNKTADDVEATADEPVGGQGPEEAAVHVIEE